MKRLATSLLVTLLFLSAAPHLVGCSGKPISDSDPAALYNDAEEDIKSDRYQIAIDKLRTVRNKFPYSKQAVDAQLRIADVYFLQELYPEAASNYETFRDLHPKHERVAYAMYRIGESYYKDIPSTVARDLGPAQKAYDAYTEALRRFPTAPEAADAKKNAVTSHNLLGEKELYIGNFYYKHEVYESARDRYKKLLENYADTPSAAEAKAKLTTAEQKAIEQKAEEEKKKAAEAAENEKK